jgi:transposase-like protein
MARKGGRPSKYDPDRHPFLVMCLAREGLTEVEMAQKLGIGKSTLTRWKQKHPEFRASLKGSREEADLKVVDSLYRGIVYAGGQRERGRFYFCGNGAS